MEMEETPQNDKLILLKNGSDVYDRIGMILAHGDNIVPILRIKGEYTILYKTTKCSGAGDGFYSTTKKEILEMLTLKKAKCMINEEIKKEERNRLDPELSFGKKSLEWFESPIIKLNN